VRTWKEALLPGAVIALLAIFFVFGLLWPLGHALKEAVHEPEVREKLKPKETLAQFAKRTNTPEDDLRNWNALGADREPADEAALITHPETWTTQHVTGLFQTDAPQWRWLLNSLLLALVVTLVCATVAYPLAYLQVRTNFWGKAWLGALLLVPLIMPPFVGAIGLRRLLAKYGSLNLMLMDAGGVDPAHPIDFLGQYSFLGIVLVMALHLYPLLYLNLAASISNIDPALLESAKNLGYSPLQVFRRVVLPLSIPGLIAGGSLVFVGAFTDLGTPLIFGYQEVIAQQIFNLANEQTSNPAGPALVGVVTLIVLALFFVTRWSLSKRSGAGGGVKGASRGAERKLTGASSTMAIALHVGVILLALIPHFSILLSGFAERWAMTVLPETWTTQHVTEALSHPIALSGVRNSIIYSAASTLIDVALGLACAWVIVRRGGWWGRVLDALTIAPLAIPGIVLAFGYVGVYSGLYMGANAVLPVGAFLILSYAVRRLPYTTRACAAGLEQTPRFLEEASGGLGETHLRTLRRVTVPLIASSVVAGAILAFSFAMLEVSDSMILANRPADYPLTKAIYHLFGRVGDGDQLASGLGLFALAFLTLSLLAAGAFLGRKWGEMFKG